MVQKKLALFLILAVLSKDGVHASHTTLNHDEARRAALLELNAEIQILEQQLTQDEINRADKATLDYFSDKDRCKYEHGQLGVDARVSKRAYIASLNNVLQEKKKSAQQAE